MNNHTNLGKTNTINTTGGKKGKPFRDKSSETERDMYRKKRNGVRGARKERIVMLTSSVLVLTALTATGIFIQSSNRAEKQDYIVDLEAIEEGAGEHADALTQGEDLDTLFAEVGTDDLDYDPSFQEANSMKVENEDKKKNKTENKTENQTETPSEKQTEKQTGNTTESQTQQQTKPDVSEQTGAEIEETPEEEKQKTAEDTAAEAISTTVQPTLDFDEEQGLVWPLVGDILINYSMDKTVFFPTLEQYKYNPAIVISAPVGENIAAAADGRVISVGYDTMLGNTVVMELGNGYELTYGQLDQITVSEGSYVTTGDMIATVASPTKYFSVEGSNLYLKLTKDGEPVNPMNGLH